MKKLNIEIKAHCPDPELVRSTLLKHHADFKGLDHQIDTYFKVPNGRLKLREGNIENSLIYYERNNQQGPKASNVNLFTVEKKGLKEILTKVLPIKIIVDKKREIYFIDNVKFHIDVVDGLGNFVEIEAINSSAKSTHETLLQQCNYYMELLHIKESHLIEHSYSDLLASK